MIGELSAKVVDVPEVCKIANGQVIKWRWQLVLLYAICSAKEEMRSAGSKCAAHVCSATLEDYPRAEIAGLRRHYRKTCASFLQVLHDVIKPFCSGLSVKDVATAKNGDAVS